MRVRQRALMITSMLKSGSLRPVISEFLTPDRWQVARRCGLSVRLPLYLWLLPADFMRLFLAPVAVTALLSDLRARHVSAG
jgi:hypothetical protein